MSANIKRNRLWQQSLTPAMHTTKKKREFSLNLIAERDATWLLFSHFATKHCVNFREQWIVSLEAASFGTFCRTKARWKWYMYSQLSSHNEIFFSSQFSKYVDRVCRIWCNNINKITTCTVMSIRRRRRNCLHRLRRRYCCYRCACNVQRFCWYSLIHTRQNGYIFTSKNNETLNEPRTQYTNIEIIAAATVLVVMTVAAAALTAATRHNEKPTKTTTKQNRRQKQQQKIYYLRNCKFNVKFNFCGHCFASIAATAAHRSYHSPGPGSTSETRLCFLFGNKTKKNRIFLPHLVVAKALSLGSLCSTFTYMRCDVT